MNRRRSRFTTLRLIVGALLCYAVAAMVAGWSLPVVFWIFAAAGALLEIAFWSDILFGAPAVIETSGESGD